MVVPSAPTESTSMAAKAVEGQFRSLLENKPSNAPEVRAFSGIFRLRDIRLHRSSQLDRIYRPDGYNAQVEGNPDPSTKDEKVSILKTEESRLRILEHRQAMIEEEISRESFDSDYLKAHLEIESLLRVYEDGITRELQEKQTGEKTSPSRGMLDRFDIGIMRNLNQKYLKAPQNIQFPL